MNRITIKFDELSYEMNEEIKLLRTNLQFCRDDRKVILVTSSIGGEGKSTITLNLAKSLAQIKKKVLLIDADLRKSVFISKLENSVNLKGLSHFLSGQISIGEVIYATNISGLHTIISGPVPPNPVELLSSPRFEKMIEALREVYDYIIIDSSPLGLVVDSAVIAQKSDGAILVVESSKIKYRFVQDVKKKLENSGCTLLGIILNKVDRKQGGKYYGKYYGKYGETE